MRGIVSLTKPRCEPRLPFPSSGLENVPTAWDARDSTLLEAVDVLTLMFRWSARVCVRARIGFVVARGSGFASVQGCLCGAARAERSLGKGGDELAASFAHSARISRARSPIDRASCRSLAACCTVYTPPRGIGKSEPPPLKDGRKARATRTRLTYLRLLLSFSFCFPGRSLPTRDGANGG